jgi:DNA-binding LacI/PurR family transcriptional regulator/biotin operon repressor
MEMKPLLKERITDQLRTQILLMQQDDYVKIAPERELAEAMNVSRISLRAAIKTLVDEGLLHQRQGKGTYVCPRLTVRSLYVLCPPDMKMNDPYYNGFLVEITNTAARLAIPLSMVAPDQHSGDLEGVLIVMGLVDSALLERVSPSFGHVILLQSGDSFQVGARIGFDDYLIGREAARALLELGHRRLMILGGPDKYPSASQRKKGFLDQLSEAGLEAMAITEKMNWSGGYRACDAVLERLSSSPDSPSGIFAVNDWMAVGLIQKLKEQGFRIPEDIAVIGCDDIPLAVEFTPSLSTFRLDMKELVAVLLAAVQDLAAGRPIQQNVLLSARLIKRETLGFPSK